MLIRTEPITAEVTVEAASVYVSPHKIKYLEFLRSSKEKDEVQYFQFRDGEARLFIPFRHSPLNHATHSPLDIFFKHVSSEYFPLRIFFPYGPLGIHWSRHC